MVTRNELDAITKRVWPLTKIIGRPFQLKNGGWDFGLIAARGIETHHHVDGNGHPTCHYDCRKREAETSSQPSERKKWAVTCVPMREETRRRSGKAFTEVIETNDHPALVNPLTVEQWYEERFKFEANREDATKGTIIKVIDVREVR
jgi:hypothetical protein